MRTVMVDFDTSGGREFDVQRPIGVWLTRPEGGIDVRYRQEVEDGEDPGFTNYFRTVRQLEDWVDGWRAGRMNPNFSEILEWAAETGYLGFRYRTVAEVEDSVTIDEAYERFVEKGEALPSPEWLEGIQIG
jgi:hypothetical protein